MSLVACLLFSHLRPKQTSLNLNMESGVVIIFLLVELCITCYHTVEGVPFQPNYQVENLEQKKAHLDHIYKIYKTLEDQGYVDPSLGIARNETMKYALMGSVSNIVNYKCTPRQQKNIKEHVVEKLDESGSFSLYMSVDSLSDGNEYFYIEGDLDKETLKVNIDFHRTLSKPEYHRAKKTVFSYFSSLYQTTDSFNNGSKDIDTLTSLAENTKCRNGSKGVCERGDVVMDTWVNTSISFQRQLSRNVPVNYVQWVGSHNSFNNKADGYGSGDTLIDYLLKLISGNKQEFVWAQQYFTMTDQLNMGCRYFMLNPVYIWDAMRLCHCGGTDSPWFDKAIQYLEKILHKTIKFDSGDLGCLPTDRLFSSAIQELHDWLVWPGHEEEVIVIMIDDYGDDKDWGRQDLIWGPITDILGGVVFNKTLKSQQYPNSWPSQSELVDMGKRVIIMGTDRVESDDIFLDFTAPGWDYDTMKHFTPYPTCQNYKPGQWFIQGGESQVVGKIYNGPEEEGLIAPANYQQVVQCPVSIFKLDLVSPGLLSNSIWSWQENYSTANLTSGRCAVMQSNSSGRWTVMSCTSDLCYHVCTNTTHVLLDSAPSSWDTPNCTSSFTSGCPIDGYQNWQIYTALSQQASSSGKVTCAWLDVSKFIK